MSERGKRSSASGALGRYQPSTDSRSQGAGAVCSAATRHPLLHPRGARCGILVAGPAPRKLMTVDSIAVTSRTNPSQRIIAAGIVFAFFYWASSVIIAILLAVLLAYFLDPVVKALERIHIPRAIGALLVLLAA